MIILSDPVALNGPNQAAPAVLVKLQRVKNSVKNLACTINRLPFLFYLGVRHGDDTGEVRNAVPGQLHRIPLPVSSLVMI